MTSLISEANALEEGVTAGPWHLSLDGMRVFAPEIDNACKPMIADINATVPGADENGPYPGCGIEDPARNAAFIARSRTLIPELSQALAQAVRENERLKLVLKRLESGEAFTMSRALTFPQDDELLARMNYARAALDPLPQQNQGGK